MIVFTLFGEEHKYSLSNIVVDDARVLVIRLNALGLLFNPRYAGKVLMLDIKEPISVYVIYQN